MPPTVFDVPINAFSPKCNVVNVIMSTNKMLPAKLSGFVVIVDFRSLDRDTHLRITEQETLIPPCHCLKKGHWHVYGISSFDRNHLWLDLGIIIVYPREITTFEKGSISHNMWQKLSIQFRNFHHNLLIISTTLHTMQHTHTGLCIVDSDIVIICDFKW